MARIRSLLYGLFLLSLLLGGSVQANPHGYYTVGVVPQQSASRLAAQWGPILKYLEQLSGLRLRFATAPDIPTFEKRLLEGRYDFAYMNPYHYTLFSETPGYRAFGHALDKRIVGILVVNRESPLTDISELEGSSIALPSPAAFAASILTRAELAERGINIEPIYVGSHDSVYHAVARRLYAAGGGVRRTYNSIEPEIRDQLRVLHITKAYTPHALAYHPRVSDIVAVLAKAMFTMHESAQGRDLLRPLNLKGWQPASDSDWDDVRALGIDTLDHLVTAP